MATSPSSRSKSLARYWRQVREVRRLTKTDTRTARTAVRVLRSRGIMTAHATKIQKRSTVRTTRAIEREQPAAAGKPYRDLDDFLDDYGQWDGYFDVYEVDTSADY